MAIFFMLDPAEGANSRTPFALSLPPSLWLAVRITLFYSGALGTSVPYCSRLWSKLLIQPLKCQRTHRSDTGNADKGLPAVGCVRRGKDIDWLGRVPVLSRMIPRVLIFCGYLGYADLYNPGRARRPSSPAHTHEKT